MKFMYKLTFALVFMLAMFLPALAQRPSDQVPSSILVFNLYASSITDPSQKDTSFSITNVNTQQAAYVHLFLINEGCSTADAFLCLTGNQTVSFRASEVDPGVTGYAIAIASDGVTGCPISFNDLIGSAYVKLDSGHAAQLPAEGYSALFEGAVPGCTNTSVLANIALDGNQYSPAGRMLAVDKIPSAVDGNSTLLVVNSLEGNLAIGISIIGTLEGTIFDDVENGLQFTKAGSCQFRSVLSNSFPLTVPTFQTFIPAGRSGWMKFRTQQDKAISGAVINFNPGAGSATAGFNGGHNLHVLRRTSGNLIVPIFPPNC